MSLQPHCGQVKKYGWLVGKVMIHSPFLLNNLQRVFVDTPAAAGAGVSVVSIWPFDADAPAPTSFHLAAVRMTIDNLANHLAVTREHYSFFAVLNFASHTSYRVKLLVVFHDSLLAI
jgi:hypothetical protein